MCASGDAFWIQSRDWKTLLDYEADLNNVIADKPITLLCTYRASGRRVGVVRPARTVTANSRALG
jgi:hypothetical protein